MVVPIAIGSSGGKRKEMRSEKEDRTPPPTSRAASPSHIRDGTTRVHGAACKDALNMRLPAHSIHVVGYSDGQ